MSLLTWVYIDSKKGINSEKVMFTMRLLEWIRFLDKNLIPYTILM